MKRITTVVLFLVLPSVSAFAQIPMGGVTVAGGGGGGSDWDNGGGSYSFSGSGQYMTRTASIPVNAYPFTICVWERRTGTGTSRVVASLSNHSSSTTVGVSVNGNGQNPGTGSALLWNGSSFQAANSTANTTIDTWESVCGVYASTTSRSAYLNGTNKGSNTAGYSMPTVNEITVGADYIFGTGYVDLFQGQIGYALVWNVALSDAEVTSFHSGGTIPQPGGLRACYNLTQNHGTGTVPDICGTHDLTVNGATYTGTQNPTVTYAP